MLLCLGYAFVFRLYAFVFANMDHRTNSSVSQKSWYLHLPLFLCERILRMQSWGLGLAKLTRALFWRRQDLGLSVMDLTRASRGVRESARLVGSGNENAVPSYFFTSPRPSPLRKISFAHAFWRIPRWLSKTQNKARTQCLQPWIWLVYGGRTRSIPGFDP